MWLWGVVVYLQGKLTATCVFVVRPKPYCSASAQHWLNFKVKYLQLHILRLVCLPLPQMSKWDKYGPGKRGGVKQRRAAAQAVDTGPTVGAPSPSLAPNLGQGSPLGSYLLELVAWRYISPTTLQKICFHAFKEVRLVVAALAEEGEDIDDLASSLSPTLSQFSKLGTSGSYCSNVHRELKEKMGPPKIPLASWSVPLKLPNESIPQMVDQRAIWPHRLMNALYNHPGTAFSKRVCPGEERLRTFWQSQEQHPNLPGLVRHVQDRGDWMAKAIPIKVYGDGLPITGVGKSWAKSANTYTVSSMVGFGKTPEIVFMIWSVVEKLVNKSMLSAMDTKRVFWKKLMHSLRALFEGEYLDFDENEKIRP